MRCYECGYQNEAGIKVCVKCGTKLEEGSAPSTPPPPKPRPAQDAPAGGAKTMRGQAASAPSWDSPESSTSSSGQASTSSNIIKCPSCSFYPLPAAPSASAPCPNCGFSGAGQAESASKTVRVESISLGDDDNKSAFKLIDEKSGKEMNFEGSSVDINRDAIDPDNNTISSSVHASFSFENGQLHIEDKSSNGSTFIKVDGKMAVADGSKIVIGNKVFTLKID